MEELDLKELFNIFWNKKVHIILIVLIFIALGIIYTVGFTTPMYQSTITLILAGEETEENIPNKITTTDITLNSKLVATYKTLIKNQDILQEVISNLDINISWENLKNSISVTAEENTGVLEVIVKTADPKNSAEVANELAKVFIEKVSEIYGVNNIQVLSKAVPDETPYNINQQKDVIMFAFAGLVIAVIYVLISNMLDTTIKRAEDIEKEFKLPVLAELPLSKELLKKKGGRR